MVVVVGEEWSLYGRTIVAAPSFAKNLMCHADSQIEARAGQQGAMMQKNTGEDATRKTKTENTTDKRPTENTTDKRPTENR